MPRVHVVRHLDHEPRPTANLPRGCAPGDLEPVSVVLVRLREYRAIRDRLLPPKRRTIDVKKVLEREAADRQAMGFLAEGKRAKRAKALKKGGKGGSGGVAG